MFAACLSLSEEALRGTLFEKDDTEVELYSNDHQTFYILSNADTVTAVWSEGLVTERIVGSLFREELKRIIDSVGETP